MRIEWNKVTWFSQIVAIALFLVVLCVGFVIGRKYEDKAIMGFPINSAKFTCADNKTIAVDFYKNFAHIVPSGEKPMYLSQTISADGARYATNNESIVFWEKGNTAFMTEGNPNVQTYKDCVTNN